VETVRNLVPSRAVMNGRVAGSVEE